MLCTAVTTRKTKKRGFTSPNSLLRLYKIGSEKETKMDFIREWKSKTLDLEQVFGGMLDASQKFHSHVFFRPTVLSEATEA